MNDTPNPLIQPTTPDLNGSSIVDTILDLDAFLAGDVRRAEKTARFSTKPWLEADIDALEARLEGITDELGRPVDLPAERAVGDTDHPAYGLAREIQAKRAEYRQSFASVRVRQLPSDDWTAFVAKHKKALDSEPPYPAAMWDELIVACAIQPAFTLDQVRALRSKLGHPQMDVISTACWEVCTSSGVSVPKSLRSSRVLKRQAPGPS